ncbi:hypothetical protein BRADI_4g29795v3 [Brachypodium distachyon]|uniref:Uncharacterized protein n=1 Tax=Brachypodium distachyon TaxID=15368 RepID=A0A2K2CR73_BRADI|nr:hypothetical protein BRADI_4g29795v3 [Brachypodium distachyon]
MQPACLAREVGQWTNLSFGILPKSWLGNTCCSLQGTWCVRWHVASAHCQPQRSCMTPVKVPNNNLPNSCP